MNYEKIQDLQLLAKYQNILSDEESEQQQKFYFKKHRHQYLVTRALVRSVLSQYAKNIDPAEWYFKKNKYGKPSIKNPIIPKLHFNISHTEKMIVLAIATVKNIGVDVEYISNDRVNLDMAKNYFSEAELGQLISLQSVQKKRRFFELWTLKESYVKACGVGLSMSLNKFSFLFSKDEKLSISFHPENNIDTTSWKFWQLQTNESHLVSLAINNKKRCPEYSLKMWDFVPMQHIKEVNYTVIAQG